MKLRECLHRPFVSTVGVIVALAGGAASATAAAGVAGVVTAAPGTLSLRSGAIAIATLPNLLQDASIEGFTPGNHYVLTLSQPLTASRQAALAGRGVVVHGYYPTYSYLVTLTGVSRNALRELDFISAVTAYQNSWKVDDSIGMRMFATPERQAIAARGDVALRVVLFPGASLEGAVADQLSVITGATVHGSEMLRSSVAFTATMPLTQVAALANMAQVQFAEELPEYAARDINQRWIVQSNVPDSMPLYSRGITGANQIIGVLDGYVASQHCAFLDSSRPIGPLHRKIVAYNAPLGNYDSHGTHVAAIAAGDQGVEGTTRGVAYDARIAFNLPPQTTQASYLERFNLHYSQGARVHTNSWGNDATRQYDYACAVIDTFMHDHEDAVIVFAVSNSSLVRNPENAKNCIGVTRTGNFPTQDQICTLFGGVPGTGPTLDGRRKPDIAAPGCSIASASGATGCDTAMNSGTSMAAPAIGGVGALVRQYFMDGFHPTGVATPGAALIPSGALIKAMLVNSSVDISPSGYPSNQEGWGRVLVDNVLPFPEDSNRLVIRDVRNDGVDSLTTDEVREYRFNVTDSSQILRVTMAFTDQPALLPATVTPVNDLDLMLVSPSGLVFVGNNLVSGFSIPAGLPDPINNLEQVRIQFPTPGTWTIRVRGTAVNLGTQGFAISATGGISEGECRADFNNDGVTDFFDYLDFVGAFTSGGSGGDFNRDSVVDMFDYLDFLSAFSGGC